MTKDLRDGESDGSSDDDDFNFESEVGSRKFPVHDCCEFEDSESLKVSKLFMMYFEVVRLSRW